MERLIEARRCAGGANTDTAQQDRPARKPMSAPILPKVAEWTRTKRNYRHAHLVLRLSLRVLRSDIQPYSEQHWAVYEHMCFELGVVKNRYKFGVWNAVATVERVADAY